MSDTRAEDRRRIAAEARQGVRAQEEADYRALADRYAEQDNKARESEASRRLADLQWRELLADPRWKVLKRQLEELNERQRKATAYWKGRVLQFLDEKEQREALRVHDQFEEERYSIEMAMVPLLRMHRITLGNIKTFQPDLTTFTPEQRQIVSLLQQRGGLKGAVIARAIGCHIRTLKKPGYMPELKNAGIVGSSRARGYWLVSVSERPA